MFKFDRLGLFALLVIVTIDINARTISDAQEIDFASEAAPSNVTKNATYMRTT